MTGLELIPLHTGVTVDRAVPNSSEAKRRLKRFESSTEISEQLGRIAAEFHGGLRKKLEKRAEDIDSVTLYSLAVNWEVIADEIDVSGIVCESEKQAVETLVDEITGHEDVDLDDKSVQELRDVLADVFTEVTATFCKRVSNDDELATEFQTTLEIDILQELRSMREEFERPQMEKG